PAAPAPGRDGAPRPPDRRGRELRRRPHLRPRHRAARPGADLPAPHPGRADHPDRRGAAVVAREVRLPPSPGEQRMSREQLFSRLGALIQQDVCNRGLARDPEANLFNACPGDLLRACPSMAHIRAPLVVVATGFYIPTADPPAFETDGPLGAVFLARTLSALGVRVALMAQPGCHPALRAGLAVAGHPDVP